MYVLMLPTYKDNIPTHLSYIFCSEQNNDQDFIFFMYRSSDGNMELRKDFLMNTQEQAQLMMLKAFLLSYMDY